MTLQRLGAWAAGVLVAACTAAPREPPATASAAEAAPGVTTATSPSTSATSTAAPAPSAGDERDEVGGSPRSPARPDGDCHSDADCVLEWQYTCDEIYHCRSHRCGYGTPVALPVGAELPAPRCDPRRQLPCTPSPCTLPVDPRATCRDHRCVFDGTWPPDMGY